MIIVSIFFIKKNYCLKLGSGGVLQDDLALSNDDFSDCSENAIDNYEGFEINFLLNILNFNFIYYKI